MNPDLTTARLDLRTWTSAELAAVLDRTRMRGWAPDFPAEGDEVIAGLVVGRPAWRTTYGHRLIVVRESGLVVGSTGLFWPPTDGALEIGYGVVPSARGLGYATEAVRALTAHGLDAPAVHTVEARVELANPASVWVLERAAYRRTSTDEDGLTATYACSEKHPA